MHSRNETKTNEQTGNELDSDDEHDSESELSSSSYSQENDSEAHSDNSEKSFGYSSAYSTDEY